MTDANRADIAAAVNRLPQPMLGLVSAVDPVSHSVKVMIQPDNIETGWLAFSALASGDLRISAPPHVGQHVQVIPQEGDAEHNVVTGSLFDDVVSPPVSPATGLVAQPGEMLIMAGCGAPPQDAEGRSAGSVTENAPYWHLTPKALYFGAGGVQMVSDAAGIRIVASNVSVTGNVRPGNGWTGNFTDKMGNVLTVTNGIITSGG